MQLCSRFSHQRREDSRSRARCILLRALQAQAAVVSARRNRGYRHRAKHCRLQHAWAERSHQLLRGPGRQAYLLRAMSGPDLTSLDWVVHDHRCSQRHHQTNCCPYRWSRRAAQICERFIITRGIKFSSFKVADFLHPVKEPNICARDPYHPDHMVGMPSTLSRRFTQRVHLYDATSRFLRPPLR